MQIRYIHVHVKPRIPRLSPILWFGIIALAILSSSVSAEYVKSGISLCINTVIPSVFPFMIISSLITVSGAGAELGAFFRRPLRLMFGASSGGACAIALGFLCGYPVGAITAADMFDRGDISKNEFEHLLTFVNIPSAAFVIGGVGGSMLSSKKMGVAIYVCVLLSAITVGMIGRPFQKTKSIASAKINLNASRPPFSYVITESISRAAKSMLGVCACVVTFSALSGTLCAVLPITETLKAAVAGFFEVSSGAKTASSIQNELATPFICAAVCGWSGLSVHTQIISACRGREISFIPFFVSKAAQAVIAPALLLLYLKFCR